jgi:hypothetical protein
MDNLNLLDDNMQSPRLRMRIGGSMVLIAAIALGFASLRGASSARVSVTFTLTICMLMGASLRAVLTRSTRMRCWCSGFSLFGWGHLLLVGSKWRKELPTDWLISQFMDLAMAKYNAAEKG